MMKTFVKLESVGTTVLCTLSQFIKRDRRRTKFVTIRIGDNSKVLRMPNSLYKKMTKFIKDEEITGFDSFTLSLKKGTYEFKINGDNDDSIFE